MGVGKVRGIVLRQEDTGESGKRIVLFAKGMGKITLSARGARNAKSKLLAGTQLFAYGDFMLFEGKGFYSVTQIDLIESFYGIRTDVERLSAGIYLLELTDQSVLPAMEADDILEFLLTSLLYLSRSSISPSLICRIYEIKILQMSGLLSEICCGICGKEEEPLYFSRQDGAFYCAAHKPEGAMPLPSGAVRALRFVLEHDGKEAFGFTQSVEVLTALDTLLEQYGRAHTDIRCKSRNFLSDIST